MFIEKIRLENFRNYRGVTAEFSGEINVITGRNAQGKTNLLEALYFICAGRSFRARSDKELINFESGFAKIISSGKADGRVKNIDITLHRSRRREMLMNGVKLKTAGELAGNFASVLFCPDDLDIIRGGASERRKFMDMCICQLRPRYAAALHEFNKAYEGKTRILRDCEEKPSLLQLLEEYDMRLAQMSAELIHYRANFIKRLSSEAKKIHAEFSGGEELEIKYATVKTIDDPLRPPAELLPRILEHQERHKAAEIASGLCLTGAHKDDLDIFINGSPARAYASQGQTRTAALSMKLAELEIHKTQRGEYPLLLLDDVLSELDGGRQNFILNRIGGSQVFITCCEDDRIAERTGGRVLTVDNGNIG